MPPGKPPDQEDAGNNGDCRTLVRGRKRDPLRQRTPPYVYGARPKAMKEKVATLIGNLGKLKWCLFEGLKNADTVQIAHCIRRELQSMDEDMFFRLQNSIGSNIKNDKGTLERQLRLDAPDNQDQMTATMHLLFDGTHGIGSGSICLLPLRLEASVKRIADNPHMSGRQMFPEYTNLFYLHVFEGEGPVSISHRGPQLRAYEDLPTGLETLEADLATVASQGRLPDHIQASTDPLGPISFYVIDPNDPSKRLYIMRSHLNVANVLADATMKLLYRKEKLKRAFRGADRKLFNTLVPTTGHWVKKGLAPPKPSSKPPAPTPDPDRDEVRRSGRILEAQTDPAPQSKPKATVPKRKVHDSAPTALGTAAPTRKRSYGKISDASEAKPPQRRASAAKSLATTPTTTQKSSARRAATTTTAQPSTRRSMTTATRSSARLASSSKTEEVEPDSTEPPKKRRNIGGTGKRR